MTQFAIITEDNVLRMIIKANDLISALEKFEKQVNNKSISDSAIAMRYSDYLKLKRK